MKHLACVLSLMFSLCWFQTAWSAQEKVSDATGECIGCHESINPGIVEDWRNSRHAATTVKEAMSVQGIGKKVSAENIPESLQETAVGCAECHSMRNDRHADAFEHNGFQIHVVVSPEDCATCHRKERDQYGLNIMAHAYANLDDNAVYQNLLQTIIGKPEFAGGKVSFSPADEITRAEGCYYCHGTRLEVTGVRTRDTDLGEMEFPVINGWPNQGVGRINTDGSLGACSSCHTRHGFSIEVARKPYTCKECHIGPDVPAYKVYDSSKHGNIFASQNKDWEFKAVPWTVGKDFTAPTCATCHVSLLTNTDGEVIAERTHQMSDRLGWRIFGLIYAHPQPASPDTTKIRNQDGLPLPTDFAGAYAKDHLIDEATQKSRTGTMQKTCLSCHSESWVQAHWDRYAHTIAETNQSVSTATTIMAEIWKQGFAQGLSQNASPFDEAIEKTWCDTWLFYANTIRFASAMAGGGDYGVFAEGRYQLTRNIAELNDWLELRTGIESTKHKEK